MMAGTTLPRAPSAGIGTSPAVRAALAIGPVGLALALWLVALSRVDLRAMTSTGLISVLPAPAFAALGLLGASFVASLRRRRPSELVLLAHVAALIFMLHALPNLVEPELRFATTWRHVGIVDTILRSGRVDTSIDAYFNWPGFFVLGAFLTKVCGLSSALTLATWAPLAFEVLYLAPLILIFRALTSSRRLVWLSVGLFYATNWVGQDYFSPQAFAYLLYLVLIAATLTWLRPGARLPGSRTRVGVLAVVVVLFAAMVPSHQLTPFAVLPGIAALVLLGRCSARGLPVLMGVILATWISYMTVAYLSGHIGVLAGGIGGIDQAFAQNVDGRLRGDAGHELVVRTRLAFAAALWTVALLSAVRRRRKGFDDVAAIALGAAPFLLPFLQPYGGEILLRIFLFSLPFTAFFVATGLAAAATALPRAAVGPIAGLAALGVLAVFLLARFGNERVDWFSAQEVAAVRQLYERSHQGSTLVSWTASVPWQYRDYTARSYRIVTAGRVFAATARHPPGSPAQVTTLARTMAAEPHGAFLLLSRSQAAEAELTGLGRRGDLARLEAALRASPLFRLLYANHDGAVFTTTPAAEGGPAR